MKKTMLTTMIVLSASVLVTATVSAMQPSTDTGMTMPAREQMKQQIKDNRNEMKDNRQEMKGEMMPLVQFVGTGNRDAARQITATAHQKIHDTNKTYRDQLKALIGTGGMTTGAIQSLLDQMKTAVVAIHDQMVTDLKPLVLSGQMVAFQQMMDMKKTTFDTNKALRAENMSLRAEHHMDKRSEKTQNTVKKVKQRIDTILAKQSPEKQKKLLDKLTAQIKTMQAKAPAAQQELLAALLASITAATPTLDDASAQIDQAVSTLLQ